MNSAALPIDSVVLLRAKLPRAVLVVLVGCIVFISTGVFAPKLLSPDAGDLLQQAVVEILWAILLIPALSQNKIYHVEINVYTMSLVTFIFFAVMSSLWSGGSIDGLMKGAALALNTFGIYVLISIFEIDVIVDIFVFVLFFEIVASLLIVAVFPDIGVSETWEHNGQWQGIFAQKQVLGITASILLFCAAMRSTARSTAAWRLYHVVAMVSAAACVVGSGSRGGGALAAGAVLLSLLSSRSRIVRRIVGFVPLVAAGLAITAILELYLTDQNVLDIDGFDVDFTERTKIWKHAIDNISPGSLLFGHGLNGFWTDAYVQSSFIGKYGWFLDNYHDGFIYILSECGLIGFSIFLFITASIPNRLRPSNLQSRKERRSFELMLGFVTLVYIIDLTETIFLRSTNFMSLLFFGFLFYCFGKPQDAAEELRSIEEDRGLPRGRGKPVRFATTGAQPGPAGSRG